MLEQSINELNSNIVKLIAVFGGQVAKPVAPSTEKPAAKQPAVKDDAVSTIEDAKKLTVALAAKNRETAVALLAEFKVKKATELKPEDIASFVMKAKEKIAAL